MDHPADDARRLVRAVRTGLVASTAFLLAAAAHVGAGGRVPSGLGLAALLTLTVVVAATVSRWRLRATVLVPVAGGLQLVLHGGFEWLATAALPLAGAGTGTGTRVGSMPSMPGMAGMTPTPAQLAALTGAGAPTGSSALPDATARTAAQTAAHAAHMAGMPGTPMVWAHVAGTLATAVLLVLADRAASRALAWWAAVLPVLLALAAGPVARAPRALAARAVPVLRTLVLGSGPGRRGPPAPGARRCAPVPA